MRLDWRGAVGILISVALLAYVLREVSPAQVWVVLRASNVALFVLSAGVATLTFPIRAWRWRYILQQVAPGIPYGPLWRATAIGMMANNVLPLRAGEVARALVLSREERRVPFTSAFASLAVDRIFDAVVILVLLVASMAGPGFPRGTMVFDRPVEHFVYLGGSIALAALLVLTLVAVFPGLPLAVWDAIASKVAPRWAERGRTLLIGFTGGLGALRSGSLFSVIFAYSVLQWLIGALSFWIGFQAVGLDAPFSAAVFLQSLLALGVAVPSAPGFFGVFEVVAVAALAVYAVPESLAVSYAIGYHILSFIPITLIGLLYLARVGLHLRDLGGPPAPAA